ERDLQRSPAVLPDRGWIFPTGVSRAEKRGRVERSEDAVAVRVHTFMAGHDKCAKQSARRRVVWAGDGPRIYSLVRLLVHEFPGGSARHGGGLDDGRTPHS